MPGSDRLRRRSQTGTWQIEGMRWRCSGNRPGYGQMRWAGWDLLHLRLGARHWKARVGPSWPCGSRTSFLAGTGARREHRRRVPADHGARSSEQCRRLRQSDTHSTFEEVSQNREAALRWVNPDESACRWDLDRAESISSPYLR